MNAIGVIFSAGSTIPCRQPHLSTRRGSMTGAPAARNGAASRVATVNPFAAAIAAICPSTTEIT
jgi:hypothetical protein